MQSEPRYRLRVYLLTTLVLVGCGALISRLYEFQILKRDFFRKQVPGNRLVTIREPGIRGQIADRNGVVLADNKPIYQVSFNLEEIRQAYRVQAEREPTQENITREKGQPRIKEESDIVEIVNSKIIPPLRRLGLAKNYSARALRTHYITHRGLVPFTYRADLTYDEFARFAEHSVELPGVSLNVVPEREYPYHALAANIIGTISPWEKNDVPEEVANQFDHYLGDEKGTAGVEATMNSYLVGHGGKKTILRNEKGKDLGLVDITEPGRGANVTLTIDAEFQLLASKTLRYDKVVGCAAAVVMDVNTGEILAMASVPDYDPNDFIPSIPKAKYEEYNKNPLHPFIDQAISAYAPGSTFKIPTAIAGSIKGQDGRSFTCSGYLTFGDKRVGCWIAQKGGSHGTIPITKALQVSCNPYFMQLAGAVGNECMVNTFQMLNFGQKTGVEVPRESPGMVIGSTAWRELKQLRTPPAISNAFLAIGQGEALASPLQLCAAVACVANGGKYYKPRLIKEIKSADGQILVADKPDLKVDLLKQGVKASDIELIHKGMWMAVNEEGGTGSLLKMPIPGIQVAGKTGTAQATLFMGTSHNAWTVAFAPYDKPKYAVCVFVRGGEHGGTVAGPLAHLILRGIFAREIEKKKLPLEALQPYAGELKVIEKIDLPPDTLAAISATDVIDETGDETSDSDAAQAAEREEQKQKQNLPKPVITPDVDREGTVEPNRRSQDNH
jgi:penicillin-binding protein 2